MPGRPRSSRRRSTAGVITPRSSAISGRSPSSRRTVSNSSRPGARRHVPARAVFRPGRHGPVRDEAAEVVDPRHVHELERALEALDPPAEAGRAHRLPVVDRIAPELSGGGEEVGRHAGDDTALEELGLRDVVGAAVRDVDRQVADQPDPLAVAYSRSAVHSRWNRTWSATASPPAYAAQWPVQYGCVETNSSSSRGVTRAPGPREQAAPARERGRGPVGRARLVGRPERQHLPPRHPGLGEPVDEAVRLRVDSARRQGGRVKQNPCAAGKLHRVTPLSPSATVSRMPRPKSGQTPSRILIQDVRPQVDCGRYPVKAIVGDGVRVTGTIIRDGHEVLGATVRYKAPAATRWKEAPLHAVGNDLFEGSFQPDSCGTWCFRIEAWVDRVASYQWELRRKVDAGQEDLTSELAEGALLLGTETLTVDEALAASSKDRHEKTWSDTYKVDVDRERAAFGAWYELFPRSWGGFKGVERVLPQLAELGFDVVYLPPVHPIGRTNRKGKNNALVAAKGEPGSPWAIGADEGGHEAVNPGARDGRGVRADGRPRPRGRLRGLHRLRDPVLARPPVAEATPRVVLPPARRHAQVRGEPAEALPGHLQRQLRRRGLARAVGRASATSCACGSTAACASSASTTRTRSRSPSGSG